MNNIEGSKACSFRNRRGVGRWIVISGFIALVVLLIVGSFIVRRAGPILKGRVIETLSTRFQGRVELDQLNVSLGRGLEVSGGGLRIFATDSVVAAGATEPVIAVKNFSFHSGLTGLFLKPMHVSVVNVSGLEIHIPPREMRMQNTAPQQHRGKIKIVVDEIVCENSRLIIGTNKPGKDPKDFELQQIVMHNVGPNDPWRYKATLLNAVPWGQIHATGTFGPWQTEDPGESSITGKYTFDHADLNTIKGISGILSSVGGFDGQLDRIAVHGTTATPDFSMDTANHPVPLHTTFEAVVDGTTGDTYLTEVEAKLGQTNLSAKGAVINIKGKGHTVDLDVDVPSGRIQDFLELAVKTQPAVIQGTLGMKAKIHIRPGKERVAEKLGLKGNFNIQQIHFSNPKFQDRVDGLSERALGDPKAAKPGAADVQSHMQGAFTMETGKLNFSELAYVIPGGNIRLDGIYSLDGEQFDFHGKVQTDAKISQMVASRWKSWLLKPVDPFFAKDGGSEIPVHISGTKSEPKFGLDLRHKKDDQESAGAK